MYCVKCGVELSDGEKKCPLCSTAVHYPDDMCAQVKSEDSRPFPDSEPMHEEFNRQGVLFILTFIFAIPLFLTLVCDMSLTGEITWSGYAASAIAFIYLVVVLPIWFQRPNPVIFVAADYIGAGAMLYYINYMTEGQWFLTFAMPVIIIAGVGMTSVIALMKYLRRGYLYIIGGALMASGAFMMIMEYFINITFGLRDYFIWSFYPLVVLGLLGIMLIIIAMCPTLLDSLKKKFFI